MAKVITSADVLGSAVAKFLVLAEVNTTKQMLLIGIVENRRSAIDMFFSVYYLDMVTFLKQGFYKKVLLDFISFNASQSYSIY